jgi:starch-binding outer membrane protein, SusD/RagB family
MKRIQSFTLFLGLAATLMTASCSKEYLNPNAASDVLVLGSPKGLMGVAVGVQRTYALSIHPSMMSAVGLSTGETFVLNIGNISEANLFNGGASVDGNNGLLGSIWISNCKAIYDANTVLAGAQNLNDAGYRSGLIGYASIFKALAIGNLSMLWENIPDTIGAPVGAPTKFITRAAGYARAVATIDKALAAISAAPISTLFNSDLPAGVDIVNTLQALRARYNLYAGNIAGAQAAANAVDLTKTSVLNYESLNPNPVFINVTSSNNVYAPIDSTFGLPVGIRPDVTDARIPFYTTIAASGTPRFRLNGFWNSATRAIPIYLPDEVRLMRAECLLRQTTPDPAAAKTIIDAVLQQTAASDPLGVGANLAAGYTGATDAASLLTEVYRNRCIELYISSNKLEDMRRFGRANAEMKRRNMPYPFRERDNNPNTPADPTF